jgi:hypothetical protein
MAAYTKAKGEMRKRKKKKKEKKKRRSGVRAREKL